ncbi:hypothetical protein CS062_11045 [Roseateles chitinivorans]|uniref:Uncharacterized protein n=1 Tax=Roseateles chitinivorans TaxID=2917965 RepID=A0A2G9CC91_9BURK|nr:hypothetical protein [Roseateles chitinivorans]PIM53129.1 hypothetical protein CS062_11045 [Roseateles chitinivorans]
MAVRPTPGQTQPTAALSSSPEVPAGTTQGRLVVSTVGVGSSEEGAGQSGVVSVAAASTAGAAAVDIAGGCSPPAAGRSAASSAGRFSRGTTEATTPRGDAAREGGGEARDAAASDVEGAVRGRWSDMGKTGINKEARSVPSRNRSIDDRKQREIGGP